MEAQMYRFQFVAAGAMLLLTSSVFLHPAAARGLGEAGELESARANARAGGPVSERDAELLERYGCLSGTQSEFCQRLNYERRHPQRAYRKKIRRY
jgi:hypothetical protein